MCTFYVTVIKFPLVLKIFLLLSASDFFFFQYKFFFEGFAKPLNLLDLSEIEGNYKNVIISIEYVSIRCFFCHC